MKGLDLLGKMVRTTHQIWYGKAAPNPARQARWMAASISGRGVGTGEGRRAAGGEAGLGVRVKT